MMEQKSSLDQTSSESFFFFNPRTPCGVRQTGGEITWTRCWFQSTHSLRSATHRFQLAAIHPLFQSTHSLRSATVHFKDYCVPLWVSIHALLAECDRGMRGMVLRMKRFNPRTPCGVRQALTDSWATDSWFQSTHSLRSATLIWALKIPNQSSSFQSTHSLRSATVDALVQFCRRIGFNPRTPCGVRLVCDKLNELEGEVSIHALLAECDLLIGPFRQSANHVSIHALLAECDKKE